MNTTHRNHFRTQKTGPKGRKPIRIQTLAIPLAGLVTSAAYGGQTADLEKDLVPAKSASSFDSIWGLANIYKDDSNPILQEFKLRGRYQGQFHSTDADQGGDSDWEDRRSRLGFDAKLFEKQLEIRADFQSNDGFRDFYDGLVDAYLRWKPTKNLSITAGKTKPLIGHYDWLESTNTQPTFERSQIFNQLNINRATAFTVEGSDGAFSWRAGVYSNDTPATTGGTGSFGDGEFGDLNGGISYSAGVGYDFKQQLGFDQALVRIDWLHSDREAGDLVLGRYDDIVSGTFWVKEGAAAVVLEAFHASGGNGADSDVFGFFIQPTYDLVPGKFQLVGRYSYAQSDGATGVRPQNRYETPAGALRGDSYHAIYAGGQYFIYGDKLKLMAGAEYAALGQNSGADRYDGYTFLAGLRLSF
jgi:phosphate-selective porin OprO and OprP